MTWGNMSMRSALIFILSSVLHLIPTWCWLEGNEKQISVAEKGILMRQISISEALYHSIKLIRHEIGTNLEFQIIHPRYIKPWSPSDWNHLPGVTVKDFLCYVLAGPLCRLEISFSLSLSLSLYRVCPMHNGRLHLLECTALNRHTVKNNLRTYIWTQDGEWINFKWCSIRFFTYLTLLTCNLFHV